MNPESRIQGELDLEELEEERKANVAEVWDREEDEDDEVRMRAEGMEGRMSRWSGGRRSRKEVEE